MAQIVGIHGIAQTYRTAPQLESEWFEALQGGLEEAGRPRVSRDSFQIVSYGALYRREGARAGTAPLGAADVQDDWDKAMLECWWAESARLATLNRAKGSSDPLGEEPTIQPADFEGRARAPHAAQRALRQLSKSRFFGAIGPQRILILGLSQVRRYLHDPAMRMAVQDRVSSVITKDTRIVVAHSLGSVVAYEALCAHPDWNVDTLITLGSPLGIRRLVFDILQPAPSNARGTRPKVQQWINIADEGDIVALEKRLDPLFGGVDDRSVYNGWKSHDVTRYLTAKVTGEAIASRFP